MSRARHFMQMISAFMRKVRLLVAIALAAVCSVMLSGPAAAAAIQKADRLLEEKKYALALSAYEAAAQRDPENIFAYRGIVKTFQAMGDSQGAVKYMDLQLLALPDNAAVLYGLGYALYNAHNYVQALDQFKRAIERRPDMAEAWNNCAAIYHFIKQDYEQARRYYEKAIELSAASGDNRVLEIARTNLANLPTAQEQEPLRQELALEEFINLFVARAEEGNNRALKLLVAGQRVNCEQAMDWFLQQAMRSVLAPDPAAEQQALLLGGLLARQYRQGFQSELLLNKLALYKSLSLVQKQAQVAGEELISRAVELEQQGRGSQAAECYQRAIAQFVSGGHAQHELTAQIYLGGLLLSLQRYPEARAAYSRALTVSIFLHDADQRAQALVGLGLVCRSLAEHEDARDFLTRALHLLRQCNRNADAAQVENMLEALTQPPAGQQ